MSTESRPLAGPRDSAEPAADGATGEMPRPLRRDDTGATRRGPVPSWLRLFNSELRLVFGRPRNLALLGLLAAVPIFFGIVFRLAISAPTGPGGGSWPSWS
jgi:hypothetical protein